MKKLFLNILISLPLLFGTAKVGAQVSIGADKAPKPFSVLELVSQYKTDTYGGLRLPRMTTAEWNHNLAICHTPMHLGFSQFKKVLYLRTQFYNIILHHDIKQNHRAKKHVEAGSTEIGQLEKAFC